jgi:cytochrome c oxidase assembly factor CtaG
VRLNSTSTWRAVGLLLTFNSLALAHAGEPLQPHDLWTAWEFDPGIVVPLVISGALYLIGIRRTTAIRRWEVACFWAGWLTLAIALISPVHPLGEALFSVHMVQHELLMVIAPPLLILGRPVVVFLWALPFKWRRRLGRAMKRPSPQLMWGALTAPFGAWLIHAIVLWGWHAPPLFQATLTSDLVHSAQHISFLGSALLFWWALLRDMRYGAGVFYLFTTAIHTSILGALLTFSATLWYPAYATRTAAWGLTPIQDQQLGGLIMWVPASLIYVIAGLWLTALWLKRSNSRAFSLNFVTSAESATAKSLVPLIVFACFLLAATSCSGDRKVNRAEVLADGNVQAGKAKIEYYGCPTCHTIPGIRGADGLVGPPLNRIASRVYIGGVLTNTPDNMVRWLRDPHAVDRLTAMPNMHIPENDARDIAAYLYTLR